VTTLAATRSTATSTTCTPLCHSINSIKLLPIEECIITGTPAEASGRPAGLLPPAHCCIHLHQLIRICCSIPTFVPSCMVVVLIALAVEGHIAVVRVISSCGGAFVHTTASMPIPAVS
jgi:hypothetical protein